MWAARADFETDLHAATDALGGKLYRLVVDACDGGHHPSRPVYFGLSLAICRDGAAILSVSVPPPVDREATRLGFSRDSASDRDSRCAVSRI